MMYCKKIFLIFFSFFFSIEVCAQCKILKKAIIITEETNTLTHDFLKNCSNDEAAKILRFARNYSGTFNKKQVINLIGFDLVLKESLTTSTLDQLLTNEISKNELVVQSSKVINTNKYITTDSFQHFQLICPNCQKPGETTAEVFFDKNNKSWIKIKLERLTQALISKLEINRNQQNLSKKSFVFKKVPTSNSQLIFKDFERLKFYKPRKNIPPNSVLLENDLMKKNLVTPQRPVKVLVNSNRLKLSIQAQPLNYGKIGDIIKLRNIRSSKIIVGTVIDFDTVVINL